MERNSTNALYVAPSDKRDAWLVALPMDYRKRWNEDLLNELCETDPPGVVLYELTTYINDQHFAAHENPLLKQINWGAVCAARLRPRVETIRKRLGWRQREADIGILRWLRRSTKLCLVVGAGVTMDAGGPSWPQLVHELIDLALGKDHEIARILPDPDGKLGDNRYIKEVVPVPPLEAKERDDLKKVREHIENQGAHSDTKCLMHAADICYQLFGQHLLKHISNVVYSRAPRPGAIHRAIAEVASEPRLTRSGIWPAWASIINYNFDGLLFDAFNEAGVPQLVCLTQGNQQQVSYKFPYRESPWWQSIFHVHGFTPSWRMNITDMRFVFAESQYAEAYTKPATTVIENIWKHLLARPPLVCLYVGCSFSDEAMNKLLTDAWYENFGRIHYALLQWPEDRKNREPTWEEIERNSEAYRVMGIQPIWFHKFEEIPDIIRSLK